MPIPEWKHFAWELFNSFQAYQRGGTLSAPSGSAWTTKMGRRFALRRFESGNNTKTMSPRGQFIVSGHLGAIPILCKSGQAAAQVGGLRLVDSSFTKIDGMSGFYPRHNDARAPGLGQRLG